MSWKFKLHNKHRLVTVAWEIWKQDWSVGRCTSAVSWNWKFSRCWRTFRIYRKSSSKPLNNSLREKAKWAIKYFACDWWVRSRWHQSVGKLARNNVPNFDSKYKGQQVEAQRKLSELGKIYGPKHPKIVTVKAELRSAEANLSKQIVGLISGIQKEVPASRKRDGVGRRAFTH